MKQVLRGMKGGEEATESDVKRERKIEGEREEINYLSLCGPYGALQLPVVKMDLRPEKCALQSTAAPLQTNTLFFFFFFLILRTVKRSRRSSKKGLWVKLRQVTTWIIIS